MAFFKNLFSKERVEIEIINFEKLFILMDLYIKDGEEKRKIIYQADYMNGGQYKRHRTRFNGKLIAITDYGYIERFRVPYTFSKSDVEEFKEKLELQTDKSLDIEFIQSKNGAYFDIKVYSHQLEEKYKFELIEPKEKDRLIVSLGYGRLGLVDFEINKHVGLFGESGSGKSTTLKTILTQLVLNYEAHELELYLSDNKGGTELNIYSDLVHCKEFTKDLKGLKHIFKILNEEAERRYKILFDAKLEDIKSYNKKFKKKKLSNILFVIEEFVAVYKDKSIQSMLQTALSQFRSIGIYILITTQRPSSKVITGDLKCNLGIILGLKTLDSNNSNVVIDRYNLLNNLRGNGHGYMRYGGKLEEFQSFYINHEEVKKRIRNVERKNVKIEEAPKTDAKVVEFKKEGFKEETTNNNRMGEVASLDFLDSL